VNLSAPRQPAQSSDGYSSGGLSYFLHQRVSRHNTICIDHGHAALSLSTNILHAAGCITSILAQHVANAHQRRVWTELQNRSTRLTETKSVIVVLENMAGAGGSVGHKFEYLRHIIDKVEDKARVGVCLDTCHLFAGGYDVSSPEAFEQVITEFDEVVGLQYLKGMHVNDSKAALGSKKDRHENVAKGLIGKDCFSFLMNDDRFNGIPLIMETPVQCEGPHIDYKLSLLAGGPVYKGPSEAETGINTDKRDIAWLNSLSRD